MKVIIAGGSGFSGSHLLQYMVGKYSYHDFINVDIRRSAGRLSSVEGMPNYRFIRGDISKRDFIIELFDRERPERFINFVPDYAGIANLLEACRLFGIRRFHQAFGKTVCGVLPQADPAGRNPGAVKAVPAWTGTADSALEESKAAFIRQYGRAYGIPATISRCCANYGPSCSTAELIPMAITRAMAGKTIFLRGGDKLRSWLYVSDHCRAIDLIVNEGVPGNTYDIAGHGVQTDRVTVRTILRIIGKPERLLSFAGEGGEKGEMHAADTSKITGELGWVPSFDFETGIRKTILWYVNHREDLPEYL